MHAFSNNQNLKPTVARKLAVGHTSVGRLVLWLLVVSSNYFTKFHDFSMIIQVFFKIHDFSMHGTFFKRITRFSMISRACGKPVKGCENNENPKVLPLKVFIKNI